jgi:glycosyltransferase involved in cell wall biosynthesis
VKIAFDQQVFLLQQYGGISRYVCNLARYLNDLPEAKARIFAPLHRNRNLVEIDGVPASALLLPAIHPKLTRAVNELGKHMARFSMNLSAPDIVHETYFTTDDYRPKQARRVVTVYDMIHERYADEFKNAEVTTFAKKSAVTRADHVICISKSTQRDLVEFFDVPIEKTSVVYLSADAIFEKATSVLKQAKSERPYFLYVGGRAGYKNFSGFVQAFAKSTKLRSSCDIVCFGGGALQPAELREIAELGLREDQVVQVGGEDETLVKLYRNAQALVYPSKYEGFGIPPLEAMSAGCPVVVSNTSSLPEVVGQAGEYFDPLETDSIVAALEKVALSPAYARELVEKGQARYKEFTWQNCAEKTLAVYRGLV